MLKVGDKAPYFCIPNQDDIEICLRDLVGKWVVLYFYPKDNTPGCSTEACDFTNQEIKFDNLNSIILGVSTNSPKQHRNFIEKKELGITLLADEKKTACEAYKVWQLKKMAGKEYMGIVRSTFIISPEQKITAVWDKVKVRTKKKVNGEQVELLHVDEVREKLKELQG
ncbi:Thiol peroxidase, Bcp-type [hydrothermal vent metagenome]|uniref:thioredoxin-dependent peroxiredoxin n=1 Tax=hydrothermal vent metagenome TaxID=652676 RepID=A0A3B1E8W1_9ZZZZ